MKRKLIVLFLSVIMLFIFTACESEEIEPTVWPSKDVEILVPYNVGTPEYSYVENILDDLSSRLGVGVTLTVMTGSSGTVATNYLLNDAEKEGHTCLFLGNAILTNYLYGLSTYTYDEFLDACTVIEKSSFFILASPKYPTLEILVKYAKDNPGIVRVGRINDNFSKLSLQVVEKALGIEVEVVDFSSKTEMADAVLSGKLDFFISDAEPITEYVSSGNYLSILACLGDKRAKKFEDVPTLIELGYEKIYIKQVYGFFFDKSVERKKVDRFNVEISHCINKDEYISLVENEGAAVVQNYFTDCENLWNKELTYYSNFIN